MATRQIVPLTAILLYAVCCQTLALNEVNTNLADVWYEEEYDIEDVWDELDCETVTEGPRPFLNESEWMFLRGVYRGVVGPEESSIGISYENGFYKKVKVAQINGKGRGIIAEEPIVTGEPVWLADSNTACFKESKPFFQFLAAISVDVACDVLHWHYIEEYRGEYYIAVDLDDGSLMNSAGPSWGELEPNIGFFDAESKNLVALRDIAVGEELLCDYDKFDNIDKYDKIF